MLTETKAPTLQKSTTVPKIILSQFQHALDKGGHATDRYIVIPLGKSRNIQRERSGPTRLTYLL